MKDDDLKPESTSAKPPSRRGSGNAPEVLGLVALNARIAAREGEGSQSIPLLVQFGRVGCGRCGPFTNEVRLLREEGSNQAYAFEWVYLDLGSEECEDAQEQFGLTQLPAFALYAEELQSSQPVVVSPATRTTLAEALDRTKAAIHKLVLDADF